ncbi:hypothetical protein B0O99DRAFT_713944 [Bisporella sp. PMI_857]|nr:hypothetical protein B0O99DRAFT_713944 [Bisporella sp. PMI_857]
MICFRGSYSTNPKSALNFLTSRYSIQRKAAWKIPRHKETHEMMYHGPIHDIAARIHAARYRPDNTIRRFGSRIEEEIIEYIATRKGHPHDFAYGDGHEVVWADQEEFEEEEGPERGEAGGRPSLAEEEDLDCAYEVDLGYIPQGNLRYEKALEEPVSNTFSEDLGSGKIPGRPKPSSIIENSAIPVVARSIEVQNNLDGIEEQNRARKHEKFKEFHWKVQESAEFCNRCKDWTFCDLYARSMEADRQRREETRRLQAAEEEKAVLERTVAERKPPVGRKERPRERIVVVLSP